MQNQGAPPLTRLRNRLLGSAWILRCTLNPLEGFQERARLDPTPAEAFARFLTLRGPIALAESLLIWSLVRRAWLDLLDPGARIWELVLKQGQGLSREDLIPLLKSWPRPPAFERVLPWLILAALLGLLGLWAHHVVWDHGCLRLLRGVRAPGGWRRTLQAESEALTVGALGAAAGLLAYVPGLGCLLSPLVGGLSLWCWVLRGFALAAFHGCESWRGVAATLLHAILATLFYGILVLILMAALLSMPR